MNKNSLAVIIVVVAMIASYFGIHLSQNEGKKTAQSVSTSSEESKKVEELNLQTTSADQTLDGERDARDDLTLIREAFDQHESNIQVEASGKVKAILRDDAEGSRHQKFILSLDNGLTVLVAHNIDLAPRVQNLKKGDVVKFKGEYEYSHQGGVIHWTHIDPQNQHQSGWLKHEGKTYQ